MYVDGGIILFGIMSGLPSQNICLIATANDDCICGVNAGIHYIHT